MELFSQKRNYFTNIQHTNVEPIRSICVCVLKLSEMWMCNQWMKSCVYTMSQVIFRREKKLQNVISTFIFCTQFNQCVDYSTASFSSSKEFHAMVYWALMNAIMQKTLFGWCNICENYDTSTFNTIFDRNSYRKIDIFMQNSRKN